MKKRIIREGSVSLDLYLKEIGQYRLLSEMEERGLAQRIHHGDGEALESLVKANLRFVVNVAKQYQNQGLSIGDLINEGNIGLVKAARRFDETRGFKFISYAVWWIRQTILQALAEQGRPVRLPVNRLEVIHKVGKMTARLGQSYGREPTDEEVAEAASVTLGEVHEALSIGPPHISLDAAPIEGGESALEHLVGADPRPDVILSDSDYEERRVAIEEVLETLTPREAEVISLWFGLNDDGKPLTLEQIGARFSLTRERVRQIKEKALRRLRHKSRSEKLWRFKE